MMRSGWDERAHCLVFDAGPLGCPVSGGHGHADLLSVQCSVFGEPCLVDPGMYCYTADAVWRDFFRGTAAHSTVVVDGEPQAVPAGPFAWRDRPSARLRRWVSTPSLDLADADHEAYRRLADPVTHRRRVLFVKPRYWLLIDDLEGAAHHRIELRFQFAPMRVTTDSELWARAVSSGGPGLWLRAFAATRSERKVVEGGIDPIQGWIAPDYGERLPAPVLVYSAAVPLPLRVVTLLFPTENAGAASPRFAHLRREPTARRARIPGFGRDGSRRQRRRLLGTRERLMCGIAGIVKLDPRSAWTRRASSACATCSATAGRTARGSGSRGRSGSATGGSRSWTSRAAISRWRTRTSAAGSSTTARSTTTRSCGRGLEARGHRYRTRSDTETILHLYEEEGERCVERLRGMFAFAIWDRHERPACSWRATASASSRSTTRSTDRELLFASEIKAILAAGGIRGRASTRRCCRSSSPPASSPARRRSSAASASSCPATRWPGRSRRAPRRAATGSCRPRRTVPPRRPRRARRASSAARLEDGGAEPPDERRAARALPVGRHRLERARRPHGADGGGADPHLRRRASPSARPTSSATRASRRARSGPSTARSSCRPAEFFEALPRLVWHEDEPIAFPSSVPLYFVSRLAEEHVKVVLTGEGADELFLGYNRYRVTAWNERLGGLYVALVPAALRERHSPRSGPGAAARRSGATPSARFLALEPGPASALLRELLPSSPRRAAGSSVARRSACSTPRSLRGGLALLRARRPATLRSG